MKGSLPEGACNTVRSRGSVWAGALYGFVDVAWSNVPVKVRCEAVDELRDNSFHPDSVEGRGLEESGPVLMEELGSFRGVVRGRVFLVGHELGSDLRFSGPPANPSAEVGGVVRFVEVGLSSWQV